MTYNGFNTDNWVQAKPSMHLKSAYAECVVKKIGKIWILSLIRRSISRDKGKKLICVSEGVDVEFQ